MRLELPISSMLGGLFSRGVDSVGETDPRTPIGIGGPSPFRFGEGGGCIKSGSRQYTRVILLSFGPHGCVKPYCCLFVCIESLLRSDRRYQTERGSVSGVSNEPNWPNPLYVALGPPFILSRGHPQVAT